MNQKEIRDQVENLIRMKKTVSAVTQIHTALDLAPVVGNMFNTEAKDIIINHKTDSLLHQWNRQLNDCKFESKQAYSLGEFLGKLKIASHSDLFASNYVRECSQVKFFGVTAERDRVGEATIHMVSFFNDLASKGLIRAVLAPLTSIELVDGKIVIVSYIAIDQPNEAIVQSLYKQIEFLEGGLPPEFK